MKTQKELNFHQQAL